MARKRTDQGHGLEGADEPVGPYLEMVDRRAVELREEVSRFVAELRRGVPGISEAQAFDEWTLQKLAGLQIVVESMNARGP